MKNTEKYYPSKVIDLIDWLVARGIFDGIFDEEDAAPAPENTMYLITNRELLCGAGALLYPSTKKTLEDIFEGDGYVVIPSSIHEMIAVRGNIMDNRQIIEMVREVNRTMVLPEEKLSDNIYAFKDDALTEISEVSDTAIA